MPGEDATLEMRRVFSADDFGSEFTRGCTSKQNADAPVRPSTTRDTATLGERGGSARFG